MEPPAPEIPDFDLIRPVGSGGFGQVWLASNRTTGHLRAVKVISLQTSGQSNPAAREISSLTRLEANLRCRHPNLLTIYHVGKTASHLFYVMDPADDISGAPASTDPSYLPATLQTRLERNDGGETTRCMEKSGKKGTGPICAKHPKGRSGKLDLSPFSHFPPEVCFDYARQLLAGLSALHAAGMVHRDVKPANCLFVGGQLKLADFGLVTEAHPLVSRVGTRKYMPPDGRMDRRADVYASGLVIYEIITGLPVDDFPRLGNLSRSICGDPILSSLLRLVLWACEREPEQRPADARAMLAELERPTRTTSHRPRRRWLAAACAACVLAAACLIPWAISSYHSQPADERVDVSFITDPYEANIYIDGVLQRDSEKKPYLTPCTVDGLPARTVRVAFEVKDFPRWDAGPYDLSQTRQIVSRRQ